MQASTPRVPCRMQSLTVITAVLLRSVLTAVGYDAPVFNVAGTAIPPMPRSLAMGPVPLPPELLAALPNVGSLPADQAFLESPPAAPFPMRAPLVLPDLSGFVQQPAEAPPPVQAAIQPPNGLALEPVATAPVISASGIAVEPAPSPAAAPAAAAAPLSGDLVKEARGRLRASHKSLTNVGEELIEAQTDVGKTKDALLGKVYDMESTAKIYAEHQRIVDANMEGRAIAAKLSAQVEELTMRLAAMHQTIIAREQAELAEETKLRVQVVQAKEAVQAEDDEKSRLAEEMNRTLASHVAVQGAHGELQSEAARLMQQEQEALQMLMRTKDAMQFETTKHGPLQRELVEAHEKGVECHSKGINLRSRLDGFKNTIAKKSGATNAAEKQSEALAKSTSQRLLAERVLLAAEVQRQEGAMATGLAALQQAQEDFNVLQADIIRQVREIKQDVKGTKADIRNVTNLLQEAVGMSQEVVAKRDGLEAQVVEMNERLSPTLKVSLEAQNVEFEQGINESRAELAQAAQKEAEATVQKIQAWAEVDGQRQAANATAMAVQTAMEEGEKQLKSAIAEAAINTALSQAKLDKAKAALTDACKSDFAVRQEEFDGKLAKCRELDSELAVSAAQVETLKQTMAAEQAAGPETA